MRPAELREIIQDRQQLDVCNIDDAEYIAAHPGEFSPEEVRLAEANIQAYFEEAGS